MHVPVDAFEMLEYACGIHKRQDGAEVQLGLGFAKKIVFVGKAVSSAQVESARRIVAKFG